MEIEKMQNGKLKFIQYLINIGHNTIRYKDDGETFVCNSIDSVPNQFSMYGYTDIFFTIDGDKSTEIKYGMSEGIVLDTHISVRRPLPFDAPDYFFRDREVMDWVLKNYEPDVVYKAMFGEKLPIDVWDKNIK